MIKTAGDAAGKTRRAEAKKSPLLKGNRWLWLKSPAALTDEELKTLTSLRGGSLKTAKAYKIKAALQDIYKYAGSDPFTARIALEQWINEAARSKIKPVVEVGRSVSRHMAGIIRYFTAKMTSAAMEGLNSRIQEVKRRAKGYRNMANFISMIHLAAGGIETF